MDFADIQTMERTVDIVHPGTGQHIGLRVHVVSIDDDRLKALKRKITDESLRLQSKGKPLKSDELERNGHLLLFTASTGWEWYNPTGSEGDKDYNPDAMGCYKGEQLDFNQKNFMTLLHNVPASVFADQLREEIDETKAFFVNSKGN